VTLDLKCVSHVFVRRLAGITTRAGTVLRYQSSSYYDGVLQYRYPSAAGTGFHFFLLLS